jgi:hypothetical protein
MDKPKVFISYAREDATAARRLCDELRHMGVEPWLDTERLLPGQRWKREIDSALQTSDYIVVLLSSHSTMKRGFVQKEVRKALDLLDQVPDSQIFLIPLRLDDCRPDHDRLNDLQWVDLFPAWEEGIRKIQAIFSFVPTEVLEPASQDIAGSYWLAHDSDAGDWKFQCIADGELRYEDAWIDHYHTNGRWRQAGNVIYIELNDKYVQLRGTIIEDQITGGEGQSVSGRHFTWSAKRASDTPTWSPA